MKELIENIHLVEQDRESITVDAMQYNLGSKIERLVIMGPLEDGVQEKLRARAIDGWMGELQEYKENWRDVVDYFVTRGQKTRLEQIGAPEIKSSKEIEMVEGQTATVAEFTDAATPSASYQEKEPAIKASLQEPSEPTEIQKFFQIRLERIAKLVQSVPENRKSDRKLAINSLESTITDLKETGEIGATIVRETLKKLEMDPESVEKRIEEQEATRKTSSSLDLQAKSEKQVIIEGEIQKKLSEDEKRTSEVAAARMRDLLAIPLRAESEGKNKIIKKEIFDLYCTLRDFGPDYKQMACQILDDAKEANK